MSIFPPNSPRRRGGNSVPAWHYERPTFNLKTRARIEGPPTKNDIDDLDPARSTQPSRNGFSPAPLPATPDIEGTSDTDLFADGDGVPFRWFSSGVLCELIRSAQNNLFADSIDF